MSKNRPIFGNRAQIYRNRDIFEDKAILQLKEINKYIHTEFIYEWAKAKLKEEEVWQIVIQD